MDNINFHKINNITYVERVVQISDYDYIFYIDLNQTSDNIKELISKHQPEFTNIIKINTKAGNKYKVLDNNNYNLLMFSEIIFSNKLIKIELVFTEKYLNFYIKDLIVYNKKENTNKRKNNYKSYNTNKNHIIRKIIKL